MQWWFKKFCKGDRSLEDEHSGQPSEVDWPIESIIKAGLLKLHENLPKNSTLTLLWSFSIWSKLQRWKSSVNGCLLSWLKIKNIILLKCHLLLFYATTNHFSTELWHVTKVDFLQQLAMTSSVFGLRRSSKALRTTKLALQKGHGHCLVVCWPSDTLLLLLPSHFSRVRLCASP